MKLLARGSKYRALLSILIVGSVFFFLFRTVYVNLHQVSALPRNLSMGKLLGSCLLLLLSNLFAPYAWTLLLRKMQQTLSYKTVFSIYYLSQLGKYLPGRIWSFLGQMHLAERQGASGQTALLTGIVLQMVGCLTSLFIFAASLLFWNRIPVMLACGIVASAGVMGLAVFRGNALISLTDLVVNKILKRNLAIAMDNRTLLQAFLVLLASWILFIPAYHLFVNAFYPLSLAGSVRYTGIYAVSWLIGFASLLTPAGLGVREGLQASLLSLFMPLPMAVVISVAGWLWLTASEVLLALLALALSRKQGGRG